MDITPLPHSAIIGSDDGYVRLIGLNSLRVITMVNVEEQLDYVGENASPIDLVRVSPDGYLLASVSQEWIVKFWDIEDLSTQMASTGYNAFEDI